MPGEPVVKAARRRSRHGLNAVMARVKVRGLQAIDGRTVAARGLLEWRTGLLEDLGGEAAVSAQQRALLEMAVRSRLYIDHADAFLMEQRSLINGRRRSLIPLVKERQALVDSLARLLGQLGLERRQRPSKSLADYIAENYGNGSQTAPAPPDAVSPGQAHPAQVEG